MYLPTNNAERSHAKVRQDCIRIQDQFLDRVYHAHASIAGLKYDGQSTPYWVESNRATAAEIRKDLAEYEASDLLRVYFARATDAGVGGRNNIRLIHQQLEAYESQVRLATGSCDHDDPYRPTGGSFGRRTGPNQVIRSQEGTVAVYQRSPGLAGLLGAREFVGNQHVRTVHSYDNHGRPTGVAIYNKDCFGNPYWE